LIAYGTEMIRSALDRETHPHELENQAKAIAFHCDVAPADIRILSVDDGGDVNVLRHFVAIDRQTSSVVLAIRGTLSISGALVDMKGFDGEFCGCNAHRGMADMAHNIWTHSGDRILALFQNDSELRDFSLVIVGHSLGAGVACLLNIKCHAEMLLGDRSARCFGFAPPPTLHADRVFESDDEGHKARIQTAMDATVCFIHDNDSVPFLSVACVRRLATLLDTVDNHTEHMWAYRRFKIFWEYEKIPDDLVEAVKGVERNKACMRCGDCEGASKLIIPARMVVWMKRNYASKYVAHGCDAKRLADMNIFVCQDMISDHLCEPYEDALDDLVAGG
jgi:Lipase (class 3)